MLDRLDAARFWSKVQVFSEDRDKHKCWEWRAGLFPNGYGQFKWRGQSIQSHRIAWMWFNGDTSQGGGYICHTCDNRRCCNPKHLFNGTAKDNVQDAIAKGRRRTTVESRQGVRGNFTKLTPDQVREIRALYARGTETLSSLSAKFGITSSGIGAVVRRKTWDHIR